MSNYNEYFLDEDTEIFVHYNKTRKFDGIHVIEYSAYNQLAYELDKSRADHVKIISDLEQKLAKATEQIKIFASYKIYEDYNFKSDQDRNYYINPVIFNLRKFESEVKLARTTLAEIENKGE